MIVSKSLTINEQFVERKSKSFGGVHLDIEQVEPCVSASQRGEVVRVTSETNVHREHLFLQEATQQCSVQLWEHQCVQGPLHRRTQSLSFQQPPSLHRVCPSTTVTSLKTYQTQTSSTHASRLHKAYAKYSVQNRILHVPCKTGS